MEEALEAARRSRVSVYAVGLVGWSASGGMDINKGLLTRLAEYTGGRAFFPTDEKEMRRAFDTVSEELHRQYRMAYFPPTSGDVSGWRSIEVKMASRQNLVVRTRLGYYRAPETSQ